MSANAKPPARYSRVPRFVLCAIGPIQPTSRNGVGRAALAKIVQASIPKALRRFVRFTRVKTLKPGSAAAPRCGPTSGFGQTIRLSSAAANPLSTSHNQRADGDG